MKTIERNLIGLANNLARKQSFIDDLNDENSCLYLKASNLTLEALEEYLNTPLKPKTGLSLTKQQVKEIIITKRTICESNKPFYTAEEKDFFKRTKKEFTLNIIEAEENEVSIIKREIQGFNNLSLDIQQVIAEYSWKEEELKQILLKPRKENRIKFRTAVGRISISGKNLELLKEKVLNTIKVLKTDTLEEIEAAFKDKSIWKQEKLELFKKIWGFTWCFEEEC